MVINPAEAWHECAQLTSLDCAIYSSFDEMLHKEQGNIELCALPTGIAWHCSMTVAALKAGMHVLVEKPVVSSLTEVAEMRRVRDDTKLSCNQDR